jgi:hypothetical protein
MPLIEGNNTDIRVIFRVLWMQPDVLLLLLGVTMLFISYLQSLPIATSNFFYLPMHFLNLA